MSVLDAVVVKKMPEACLSFGQIPPTPYHNIDTKPFLRAKYFEIVDKLENTAYSVAGVISYPYQEVYEISRNEGGFMTAAIYYNGAGIFRTFVCQHPYSWSDEVIEILNAPAKPIYEYCYKPSTKSFSELHNMVCTACDGEEYVISNIKFDQEHYYIDYYVNRGMTYGYLKFWFNKRNEIRKMQPCMLNGGDLESFKRLASTFKNL